MKNTRKFTAAAAALGIAATIVATAPAASAEPVSNGLVAVGSDTLQDVLNALANGTSITGADVRSTAGSDFFGSFDATGSANIQAKPGGPRFGRPNGSGDGVKALSRSIDGAPYTSGTPGAAAGVVIKAQVDIARSSSGAAVVADGALRYIPFGRDALSYAHNGTNAAFDHIDAATLKGIFNCSITTIGGVTVTPVIPQSGSGTRKDFIKAIGSTDNASGIGPCVQVGQEHDTSSLPANAVTPISVAQWVAQNTGAGANRIGTGVKLGSPTGVPAASGTGAGTTPSSTYYANTTWGRDTYLVVENARLESGNSRYDAKLANLVSSSGAKLANHGTAPATAGAVKKKFGFLAPASTTSFRAATS